MIAYGLRVTGLEGSRVLLPGEDAVGWPRVHVSYGVVEEAPTPERFDLLGGIHESRVDWHLEDGMRILLDRNARTAAFLRAEPLDSDDVAHPSLGPAAAMFARWDGREAFHGGAFVVDGGSWAALGHKEAGKSTLMAGLALAGVPVLTDDVLVLDGLTAFAGPRCIDLRASTVELLGVEERVRPSRAGSRHRLDIEPIVPTLPFRGWVFLAWGDDLRLARLAPSEALRRIAGALLEWKVPADARALLELGLLPAFELRRQPSSSVPEVVEYLAGELAQLDYDPLP